MKVLMCHNYYQQRGGEDLSFEAEAELLESHGHTVIRYTLHNDRIRQMSAVTVAGKTLWNREVYREVRGLIRTEQPDLLHCTNTFPLISPAAADAAREEGVPVVQSLRNYRLLCPNAQFLREHRICEDCLGRSFAWPGVLHKCYRDSRAATFVLAATNAYHHWTGTYQRKVDQYFTCSEFARRKLIEGGIPADRIVAKPDFVGSDPGPGTGAGGYAVFVGRLSTEKGLDVLIEAWRHLDGSLPLWVVGEGPLEPLVREAAKTLPIRLLGHQPLEKVLEVVGDASFLVMPSVWYETFGRTIAEAYAKGTPVIVSDLGAMAERVEDDRTGLKFPPGDALALADAVQRLLGDPARLAEMRSAARAEFLAKFTGEANYPILMDIYQRALATQRRESRGTPRAAELTA